MAEKVPPGHPIQATYQTEAPEPQGIFTPQQTLVHEGGTARYYCTGCSNDPATPCCHLQGLQKDPRGACICQEHKLAAYQRSSVPDAQPIRDLGGQDANLNAPPNKRSARPPQLGEGARPTDSDRAVGARKPSTRTARKSGPNVRSRHATTKKQYKDVGEK